MWENVHFNIFRLSLNKSFNLVWNKNLEEDSKRIKEKPSKEVMFSAKALIMSRYFVSFDALTIVNHKLEGKI